MTKTRIIVDCSVLGRAPLAALAVWFLAGGSDRLHGQAGGAGAGLPERTQTIALTKGWNAVYLEVQPRVTDPEVVFANLPIAVAATWFGRETPLEYISDPDSKPWKAEGWGVWYAPSRPDAFLKTLHAVHGAKAYLLFAEQDYSWTLTGRVILQRVSWKPDSFNLVGFGLDPQSPPTFGKFFAGSAAHQRHRIYRLVDGGWRLVTSPSATLMRAGEAFWAFCDGASDYQGPVDVKTSFHQGMVMRADSGWSTMTIRNRTSDPVEVEMELAAAGGAAPPLAYVALAREEARGSVDRISVPLGGKLSPPALEAGIAVNYRFELRAGKMTSAVQRGYLTVATDVGTRVWIPVTGVREDRLEVAP